MNKNSTIRQLFLKISAFLLIIATNKLMASNFDDELTFWRGVNTYHVDRQNDNADDEQNRITAVFYNRWFVGFFNNSYSKPSEIVGYQAWHSSKKSNNWRWQYGLSVALATGYKDELASNLDGLLTFGISPYFGLKYQFNSDIALGLDSLYLPTDNGGVFVSGINFSVRIK